MSLRVRLVAALGLLLAIGLGLFGFATYSVYARLQHQRLDETLQAAVPFARRVLNDDRFPGLIDGDGNGSVNNGQTTGQLSPEDPTSEQPGGDGQTSPNGPGPFDTFAVLLDSDGTVVRSRPTFSTAAPDLPDRVQTGQHFIDLSSSDGSGDWRAYTESQPDGSILLVAVPTTETDASLNRLILIEVVTGAALLALLLTGSWFVMRRELRPLETMAHTAVSISEGDLSQRVTPADDRTEVGQLGLALNTMLGGIEQSFAEQQATEDRLRQFLADASHELRTPLTSIRGFAELFRLRGDSDLVDRDTMVRRIEEESARMNVLVDDLLLLARLDQTRPAERAPVDLAVLAADACTDAVAVDPSRAITLEAPRPVIVAGDDDHLRQAIANLVSNALRHTPVGSPVEVTAGMAGGMAYVRVRDHGGGLDREALAHVFDRFWRADEARTRGGVGLGLSIVAAIADEHRGSARAANADGGGAEFTIELPVAAGRSPAPAVAPVAGAV